MLQQANFLDDIIAAISTPLGSGGIGIVRMSGKGCIALADTIFQGKKKLTEKPSHTLSYGKIDHVMGLCAGNLGTGKRKPEKAK